MSKNRNLANLIASSATPLEDLIASAPSALNTLDELAAALNDDANFATTVTNALAAKAPLASPTFTGDAVFNSTSSVKLPIGTTAQRPASPTEGMQRYNTDLGIVETYHGSSKGWVALSNIFQATGGTESTIISGGVTYKVHTFTSSENFVVQSGTSTVQALLVAGGGGGGENMGGGGGAGGFINWTSVTTSVGSYAITIGSGGAGGIYTTTSVGGTTNGSNSSAIGLTAIGGGRGGTSSSSPSTGQNGGSGGGGNHTGDLSAGTGTSGQGNNGGAGRSNPYCAGGGGGASGGGSTGDSSGLGGDGVYISDFLNAYVSVGGGGGGQNSFSTNTGTATSHGGGRGGRSSSLSTNATTYGSGGGGGCWESETTPKSNATGSNGYGGIVVIRYPV